MCPNGYFGSSSSPYVCSSCDNSCNGCVTTATNCILCYDTTYFLKIGSNGCTTSCGSGYYGSTATGKCTICPVGCNACSMSSGTVSCSSCKAVAGINYYLYGNQCYSVCPSTGTNQPQFGDSSNLSCALCHTSCKTCSGSLSVNCLSCSSSSYLIYGTG